MPRLYILRPLKYLYRNPKLRPKRLSMYYVGAWSLWEGFGVLAGVFGCWGLLVARVQDGSGKSSGLQSVGLWVEGLGF